MNLKVLVDSGELPRQAQATADSGWFEPDGKVLKSGSRGLFWDIAVKLPTRVLAAGVKDFTVRFDYDTVSPTTQPRLDVEIHLKGRDGAYVQRMPRPTEVFVGSTENTKQDNRMETAIVARGVTLAGWLVDPHRYDPPPANTGSEDWHYDILLDPDFIERNYASPTPIEPVASAWLPGNVVPLIRGPATPIRLLSSNPAAATSKPTAAAFTLAGDGDFTVELNAWHNWAAARGPKPPGWVSDPDSSKYSGNAWPFDPRKGIGPIGQPDLQAGEYVVVSGTLWQDTSHSSNPQTPIDRLRKCFDGRFKGHGGWLEIHPVDAVRRVDAPKPRKHVLGMSACHPDWPDFDRHLAHPEAPPSRNAQLRFETIVDDRFTSANAVHTEVVNTTCEPPLLRATANVPANGSYSATYILWWEETNQPRTGTAVCTPAISPILGDDVR